MSQEWKQLIFSFDDRRDIIITDQPNDTLSFCAEQFIAIGQAAIKEHGQFNVALSGGSTPKAIFQVLSSESYRNLLDWNNVYLFWSDERCVPPNHPDSNYHMAMEAGFASLSIPQKNIFRMPADSEDLENAAEIYEQQIIAHVPNASFDLIMLGMGEDGHTASLFPKTHGLHTENQRLVIANYIPQKNTWRMTFTYECINNAKVIAIYVFGKSKAHMLNQVLSSPYDPDTLPIQRIGTRSHKALWLTDKASISELKVHI